MSKLKPGTSVLHNGSPWQVIGDHPQRGQLWLGRWVRGKWQTCAAGVKDVTVPNVRASK